MGARLSLPRRHNRDIDHLCSSTTATIALQLELEVVAVVWANIVIAAKPVFQHAYIPNDLLVLEIMEDVFSVIGFTLYQTES